MSFTQKQTEAVLAGLVILISDDTTPKAMIDSAIQVGKKLGYTFSFDNYTFTVQETIVK